MIWGVSTGADLADVTAALGTEYIDDSYGRQGSRILRRDYGLFEATFVGEPKWICKSITVEVHRAAPHPELVEEVLERHRLNFPRYTTWEEVKHELLNLVDAVEIVEIEPQAGYKSFSVDGGKTKIYIVSNSEYGRGDLPGDGDVWKIEMS